MKIVKTKDVQILKGFTCGIPIMDNFICQGLQRSMDHGYCCTYAVVDGNCVAAMFALSFDSVDLDSDDKEELSEGISSAGTPQVSFDYEDTFYSKRRYPALDIAYLAVATDYKGKHLGSAIVKEIAKMAAEQDFAGCQFLSVEALKTKDYSAVGFYQKCGFTPNELPNPNKDTLRMFKTLRVKSFEV